MKKLTILLCLYLIFLSLSACLTMPINQQYKKEHQQATNNFQNWAREAFEKEKALNPSGSLGCSIGYWPISNGIMVRLLPKAINEGFKHGDQILGINNCRIKSYANNDCRHERLKYKPGQKVSILVNRDQQELRIVSTCIDLSQQYKYSLKALEAAANGDWSNCIKHAYEAEYAFLPTASLADLRRNCNNANHPFYQGITSADAALVYETYKRVIEEQVYVEDGLNQIRGDILAVVDDLNKIGYSSFANDLKTLYKTADASKTIASSEKKMPPAKGGFGTCFVVSPNGDVLTNHHVIDGQTKF